MSDSIEALKRRAEFAERQLIARDRADTAARLERIAQEQRDHEEKAAAERAEALKTSTEETRRGAWTNYLIAETARRDPTAPLNARALMAAVPQQGWPPGVSEGDFHFTGQSVGHTVDDVAETSMGKALAEMLERSNRVRNAK